MLWGNQCLTDQYFNWFQIIATLDPKTIDLFHFTGPYQSTPACPVQLVPNFNPSSAAPTFQESDPLCSTSSVYSIPFFLQRPGPKNEEWTINAHEASPGHYTQVGRIRITKHLWTDDANNLCSPFKMKWKNGHTLFTKVSFFISEPRVCGTFPRQL